MQKNQRAGAGETLGGWSEDRLLFPSPHGIPLDPGYVRRALHKALAKSDLPILRVHDLRHTAASYLLSTGTHPKVVQEMLGHSSITVTLDVYSHVVPTLWKGVTDSMEILLHEDSPLGSR